MTIRMKVSECIFFFDFGQRRSDHDGTVSISGLGSGWSESNSTDLYLVNWREKVVDQHVDTLRTPRTFVWLTIVKVECTTAPGNERGAILRDASACPSTTIHTASVEGRDASEPA